MAEADFVCEVGDGALVLCMPVPVHEQHRNRADPCVECGLQSFPGLLKLQRAEHGAVCAYPLVDFDDRFV